MVGSKQGRGEKARENGGREVRGRGRQEKGEEAREGARRKMYTLNCHEYK